MHSNEQNLFNELDSFMTVHHLTLRGTNFQIGQKLAELAMERHGQSIADHTADPVYAKAQRVYFQRNYPIHWERMRGVAAAFGSPGVAGTVSVKASVAQLLAAIEMNWSLPCGNPVS